MEQNYRNTDPQTSKAAGDWITMTGKRASLMDKIFKVIELCEPISVDRIAKKLNHPHRNAVAKRVSDLINEGKIMVAGETKGDSGREIQTYVINPNPEPLEKKSRTRELQDEVDRLKKVNLALRREIARLRNGTAER